MPPLITTSPRRKSVAPACSHAGKGVQPAGRDLGREDRDPEVLLEPHVARDVLRAEGILVPVEAELLDRPAHRERFRVAVRPGRVEHQDHLGADGLPDRGTGFDVSAEGDVVACPQRGRGRVQLVAPPPLVAPVEGLVGGDPRGSRGARRRSRRAPGRGAFRATGAPASRRPCRGGPRARRRPIRSRSDRRSGTYARPRPRARRARAGRGRRGPCWRKVTICSPMAAGPGPGKLRNVFPSSPSSVRIDSTPNGTVPPAPIPNGSRARVLRSCRTTLTSVIRIGRRRKLDRYPDVAPPNWGARTTAARVRDPSLAISRRRP